MTDGADDGRVDDRLAAAYAGSRARVERLALEAPDPDVVVPACPGWTAHDLVAHLAALATDLSGRNFPAGDTQAWVDAQVADRRTRSMAELIEEWSGSGPAFEAMIAAKPHRWWGLVYDLLVHEHDLRGAIERTPVRDGEAVDIAVELGMRLVASDLETAGLPAFRLVTPDGSEHLAGVGGPELTLEATPFEALRLLGSRRTIEELRAAAFTGDLDRYLPGLLHMDLPTGSLHER